MEEQDTIEQEAIASTEVEGYVAETSPDPTVGNVEQSALPEKFKSTEDMARAYEESEKKLRETLRERAELQRQASEAELLRQRVIAYENTLQNPVQATPYNEGDEFNRMWEEDPRAAVQHEVRRAREAAQLVAQQNALTAAYMSAKSDSVNFPNFSKYEPTMGQIANQYRGIVHPSKLNSPEIIPVLYELAKARHLPDEVESAKRLAIQEFEQGRSKKEGAFSEGSSPTGHTGTRKNPEDYSLAEMEKILGFAT